MFWFSTKYSICQSVINAMSVVENNGFNSVALPLIGSGSGNRGKEFSLQVMLSAFSDINSNANAIIVKYKKG